MISLVYCRYFLGMDGLGHKVFFFDFQAQWIYSEIIPFWLEQERLNTLRSWSIFSWDRRVLQRCASLGRGVFQWTRHYFLSPAVYNVWCFTYGLLVIKPSLPTFIWPWTAQWNRLRLGHPSNQGGEWPTPLIFLSTAFDGRSYFEFWDIKRRGPGHKQPQVACDKGYIMNHDTLWLSSPQLFCNMDLFGEGLNPASMSFRWYVWDLNCLQSQDFSHHTWSFFYILYRTVVLVTCDLAGHVNIKICNFTMSRDLGDWIPPPKCVLWRRPFGKVALKVLQCKNWYVTWVLVLLKFVWCFCFFPQDFFVIRCF